MIHFALLIVAGFVILWFSIAVLGALWGAIEGICDAFTSEPLIRPRTKDEIARDDEMVWRELSRH